MDSENSNSDYNKSDFHNRNLSKKDYRKNNFHLRNYLYLVNRKYKKWRYYKTCTHRPYSKICTTESQKACPILNEAEK